MSEQDRHNLFSELVARHQSELYAYIFAIVQNWEDAHDLYQCTCLVLWRKFDTFRPGSSFFAWARETAKLEVRSFLRRRLPSNRVSDELLDALADIRLCTTKREDDTEPYLVAMRRCRQKLSAADDELLQLRYVEDLGTREIAHRLQRLQSNVCHSLNRIRGWLLECIRMEIARQEHPGKEPS
jgi:RNA polymerase sigma-70 factor, ECF subfamily